METVFCRWLQDSLRVCELGTAERHRGSGADGKLCFFYVSTQEATNKSQEVRLSTLKCCFQNFNSFPQPQLNMEDLTEDQAPPSAPYARRESPW